MATFVHYILATGIVQQISENNNPYQIEGLEMVIVDNEQMPVRDETTRLYVPPTSVYMGEDGWNHCRLTLVPI
jgi:hypothetical protein